MSDSVQDELTMLEDPAFRLAYLSLVVGGTSPITEQKLLSEYLRVSSLANPKGLIARVKASIPIWCVIKSVSYEDSSQRYVVTFRADKSDRDETVRSDRVDARGGQFVRDLFGQDGLTGKRAVIYKLNERAGEDQMHSHGYRVCPYMRLAK